MTASLLDDLGRAGVVVFLDGDTLCYRAGVGVLTTELRSRVTDGRSELIATLRMPADPRARAAWLGRLGRSAGIDAQALFDLIDAIFGRRTLGPYELDAAETDQIAAILRTEIGKRPPIIPPAESTGDLDANDGLPASIERKKEIGMTDAVFAKLCLRVLGRPGIRSAEDDAAVLAVMPRRARS